MSGGGVEKHLLISGLKIGKSFLQCGIGVVFEVLFCKLLIMLNRKSESGFTLIEVTVAIAIFGLVIAGGLIGVRRGFEVVEHSRHYTRVSQILQSELEELRTYDWDVVNGMPATTSLTIDPEFDNGTFDIYTVTRNITVINSELKQIDVIGSYVNRRGQTVTMSYTSFYSKEGVNDYYYRVI